MFQDSGGVGGITIVLLARELKHLARPSIDLFVVHWTTHPYGSNPLTQQNQKNDRLAVLGFWWRKRPAD